MKLAVSSNGIMTTLRLVAGIVGYVALFAALLFLPAGSFDWWRAWVLLAVLFVLRTATLLALLRATPALFAERSGLPVQPGQPALDKVLVISFMATYASVVAFASFDVFRLHLLPAPAPLVSLLGLILFAFGWCIVGLVLMTNAFAATTVRHQSERGHQVVTGGVYAVVRHPMYAGLVLVMAGMCLWLGSYAAALVACVPVAILITRIHVEERFLREHLQGYLDYSASVRYRLIPGLW